MKKELKDKKKELMQLDWTENVHHSLEKMDDSDVKEIVESMTEEEICSKVNNRKFQEDYIGDYIQYLWHISKPAYWKHVIATINSDIGLLWGGDMDHFQKMCNMEIPDEILDAVLKFCSECDDNDKQDLEAIGCVVKAQIDKFSRLSYIMNYVSNLPVDVQSTTRGRIEEFTKHECAYNFY